MASEEYTHVCDALAILSCKNGHCCVFAKCSLNVGAIVGVFLGNCSITHTQPATYSQNAPKKDDPILAEDPPAWEKSCFTNDTLIDISSLVHRTHSHETQQSAQTQWNKKYARHAFFL